MSDSLCLGNTLMISYIACKTGRLCPNRAFACTESARAAILPTMNVLIIEDEKRNFNRLRRLLQEIDYTINVDGPTASVDETADYLSSHTPDLILADIRLTDGLSFDTLERTDVQSPVIFITAYDEYAIRAFKYNGIDYLLKPVDPDELAAVDKARRMRRQATEDNMRQLIEQMRRGGYRWRERFLVAGRRYYRARFSLSGRVFSRVVFYLLACV